MSTSKRETLGYSISNHSFGTNGDLVIEKLKKQGKEFYFRKTNFITTIICDGENMVIPDRKSHFNPKQLWVFSKVKYDVKKFLSNNPDWEPLTRMEVNRTNYDYDSSYGTITGTDIDSAYWTIAHNCGYISQYAYEKAAHRQYKVARLAALAVLGRKTYFHKMQSDGLMVKNAVTFEPEDIQLYAVYRDIRYRCFAHMGDLADLLGDDFEAYRTDCIYYRDTIENRKKVYEYLDYHGFTYKQLEYGGEGTDNSLGKKSLR